MHCLISFTQAISNEKFVDDLFCKENGGGVILQHSLPLKIYRSIDFVKKHRTALKITLFLFDYIFFWGIGFLFLWKTISFSLKKIFYGKKTNALSGKILLNFTPLLLSKIQFCDLWESISEYTILMPPHKTQKGLKDSKHQMMMIEVASVSTFFQAFIYTLREIVKFRKIHGAKNSYHFMKAYDWFLTRLVLEKNSEITQIVYANMIDRWAFLFSNMDGVEKIMLQHGILNDMDMSLPQKTGAVNILYCFDDSYLPYFQHFLTGMDEIRYIKSTFKPVPCEKHSGTVSVLLVANPVVDFEKEKEIVDLIQQYPQKFDLYIKPHPAFSFLPYLGLKKIHDFRLIEDKKFFPAVDVVLSYESTLAMEYKSVDIPVYFYTQMSSKKILQKINLIADNE